MYNFELLLLVATELDSFHKDCAITVALKIADDSCKMDDYEKELFMKLYDAIPLKESNFFEKSVFELVDQAKKSPTAKIYAAVKKEREIAMEMITRPKMKEFKASVRKKLSK